MGEVAQIAVPVPYLGSVNVWLLPGEPLTLVDTGPANDEALGSLEQQLSAFGHALEDIELVLITHHHLDHAGLAGLIKERADAEIAAHRGTARWGRSYDERVAEERSFTVELLRAHGVPDDIIEAAEPFFVHIRNESRSFETDRPLRDGDRIVAGGRTLRVVFRPGHSTTDTLFVDDEAEEAFVGDHLLANITSGAELMPTELPGDERRQALLEYLSNLRKTQVMQLRTCYPGHGPPIEDHRRLIDERMAFHSARLDAITRAIEDGCETAFEIAGRLWPDDVVRDQSVLAVWEVLGHLDILVNRGTVSEAIDGSGRHRFRTKGDLGVATAER
jgi:glyoxylase-like metal-dependent hydrolase (beta-lactamase superfamily II)